MAYGKIAPSSELLSDLGLRIVKHQIQLISIAS